MGRVGQVLEIFLDQPPDDNLNETDTNQLPAFRGQMRGKRDYKMEVQEWARGRHEVPSLAAAVLLRGDSSPALKFVRS
jgi:hypothetical protein